MPSFGDLEMIWRRRAADDVGGGGSEDNFSFTDFAVALAEAEEQWCRRTLKLYDAAQSTFLQLSGSPGTASFPLDPRILDIKRVKPDKSGVLLLASLDELDLYSPTWQADPAATPVFYATDLNKNTIHIYPKMVEEDVIRLSVARLPLTSPSTPSTAYPVWTRTDSLEILPIYHIDLLDWVTYRLYDFQSRQDERPEVRWYEKSREAYERFELKFGKPPTEGAEAVKARGYPRELQYGNVPPPQAAAQPAARAGMPG